MSTIFSLVRTKQLKFWHYSQQSLSLYKDYTHLIPEVLFKGSSTYHDTQWLLCVKKDSYVFDYRLHLLAIIKVYFYENLQKEHFYSLPHLHAMKPLTLLFRREDFY